MTWTCCGTARWPSYSAASARRPRWGRSCAVYLGQRPGRRTPARELLVRLARPSPLLPGAGALAFIDIDSMQKRVYGHAKQGAGFGHTKIQAAPRGALSYPRCSREKLGGRFLGLMAYLDPKGEGNNSMPRSNDRVQVWNGALRGPRDMAKAELPVSQSPDGETWHPPERYLKPAPRPVPAYPGGRYNLREVERYPARAFKEMNGEPKSR